MMAMRTYPTSARIVWGGMLLIAGLLVLSAYGLHASAWWSNEMLHFGADSFGTFTALGLASLHLVHMVAFNSASLAMWTAHFLVSFWPLIPIAVGLYLLEKQPGQIQ